MADQNIDNAIASDLKTAFTDFSVDTKATEGPTGQKEYEWTNSNFTQYYGYYHKIPELNSTIDARATWTVGKGFESDPETTLILDSIHGNGMDTFNTILENMIRTMMIGGDAFCEIIRDEDEGMITNLKPLDPSTIKIVSNAEGMILRYEQMSKIPEKDGSRKTIQKFEPEEMFHLARNRVADEVHGTSVVEKLEAIILMRNEAMTDYKLLMHRYVVPQIIWHLDTDIPAKIAKFKAMRDKAHADRENIYIPKGAVEREVAAVSGNATLSPLAWIESLNDYFYEACATPKIVVGNSKNFTEAASNTVYLAFQQSVEEEQLFVEEQVGIQLGIEIELTFPASIQNSALSDTPTEQQNAGTRIQPNETTVGGAGVE